MKDLKNFRELKKKHPDAIILFRKRYDVYECYNEDSLVVDKVCGVTRTTIKDEDGNKAYYASFPYTHLDTFLPRLIRAGHRVAICEEK